MPTVAKGTRETVITLASASAGPFSVGFRLFDDDALDVFVNGTRSVAWTLSSTYANGYDDAATITFDAPLAIADEIVIQSALKAGRAADYVAGDPLLVAKMNVELARLWSSVADVQRNVARAIKGFAALDPVSGLDLDAIANAENFALRAEAAEAEAEAAAALAISAQENLFDAWRGSWVTATAYAQGELVREAGSTYICLVAHTSGTFSTDLSAARWAVFAQQGAAGAGTGDVLAANNGSDFADAAATLSNLGGQPVDATLTSLSGLSLVEGDLLYATGADTLVRLPKGTAGQVLAMNSGATAPEWTNGGPVLLATWTRSTNVTEIDFTDLGDWDEIGLEFRGVVSNSSANGLRVSFDNGSAYQTTGYDSAVSDGAGANNGTNDALFTRGVAGRITGHMRLSSLSDSGESVMSFTGKIGGRGMTAGGETPAGVVNAIRIRGGTYSAGRIRVFGIRRV